MDPKQPSPIVKPEIAFLFEVVNDAVSGKLRIPDFQRRFVWDRKRMLDLLDSIWNRYPIGSLLVWDATVPLKTKEKIGPIRIPPGSEVVTALVLDGHQRLSTLTGTLIAPPVDMPQVEEEDPGRWNIWFSAKDKRFEHLPNEEKPDPWHFPMRKLMDTLDFLNECERMRRDCGADGDRYVRHVQDLLRVFQGCQLPLIRIRNTELLQAVNIFARLNSTGKKISADEMVAALTYREGQKTLADHIDDLLVMLDGYGFGDIDRTIVLRALLACLGEDIYRTDWTRFEERRRDDLQEPLTSIVESAMSAMEQAAKFLNKLGVYHERLLPYAMQMVVLTAFFHGCQNPTLDQEAFLRRWFWVSSFAGWFASGNPSRVNALVKEMRAEIAKQPSPNGLENMHMGEPAQPFPKDFDMRSARARTWMLVLLNLGPRHLAGYSIENPWKLVAEHGPNAIGYIVATARGTELKSSPANRILRIDIKDRRQALTWLTDSAVSDEVLTSHGIPPESRELLLADDRIGFLEKRRDHLIKLETEFMRREGVTAPRDLTPQISAIDRGEDA